MSRSYSIPHEREETQIPLVRTLVLENCHSLNLCDSVISVPMDDFPGPCFPAIEMRDSQRYRSELIKPNHTRFAPFNPDGIRQVAVHCESKRLEVDVPTSKPCSRPLQARAHLLPTLLICPPTTKNGDVVGMRPTRLIRGRVAGNEGVDCSLHLIYQLLEFVLGFHG